MNMNNREDKDLAILCNAKSDDLKGLYDDVSNELYRYGGNTIITFFTHRGVEYRELVIDICQRLEVDFDKEGKIDMIEYNLLQKILTLALHSMSINEIKGLINEMNNPIPTHADSKQILISTAQMAIQEGRLSAYTMANILIKLFRRRKKIRRVFAIAANSTAIKYSLLCVLGGPIGWIGAACLSIWAASGPAFRVCIPDVIQVCYIRARMKSGEA
jgi:uncharacterized protein YaaW (UPF0174 family)